MVDARLAASAWKNARAIRSGKKRSNRKFEIASVLVRLDHVASVIEHANHGVV
jgi:hypothetical protein